MGYPEEDHRVALGSGVCVYNDTVSDKRMLRRLRGFVDSAISKNWSRIVIMPDKHIRLPNDLRGLLNDAEFTFLYPNHERVGDIVRDAIIPDVTRSLEYISTFLRQDIDITSVSAVRQGSSRPTRITDFPFQSIVSTTDPMIVMLRKSEQTSFHIQATIGCPMTRILDILTGLIAMYRRIVPRSHHLESTHNLEYIRSWRPPRVSNKIIVVATLFLHYFMSHTNPKRAVFIVRHVFKDIIRSVDHHALRRTVRAYIERMPVFEGADGFLDRLYTSTDKYEHQQKMITVTNFPFDGTNVLVEFRVIHPIIATQMGLRWDDLIPLV